MTRKNNDIETADCDFQMLTAQDVAARLQISVRGVWRQVSKGLLPEPVYVGRLARWPLSELKDWMDQGCPPRNRLKR